jgi:hypothetical protein
MLLFKIQNPYSSCNKGSLSIAYVLQRKCRFFNIAGVCILIYTGNPAPALSFLPRLTNHASCTPSSPAPIHPPLAAGVGLVATFGFHARRKYVVLTARGGRKRRLGGGGEISIRRGRGRELWFFRPTLRLLQHG